MSEKLPRDKYYRRSLNRFPQSLRENDEVVRASFKSPENADLKSYAELFCLASLVDEAKRTANQVVSYMHLTNKNSEQIPEQHKKVLDNLQSINHEVSGLDLSCNLKEYLQFVRYIHVVDHCENDEKNKELAIERYNHKLMHVFAGMSSAETKQLVVINDIITPMKIPSIKPAFSVF